MHKVRIEGFLEDPTSGGGGGSGNFSFTAKFNPTSIKRSRSVQVNADKKNNLTTKDIKQFDGQGEETLSFSLVLDGTIKTEGGHKESVLGQLEALNRATYMYHGSAHRTPYCAVYFLGDSVNGDWATTMEGNVFFCHLKTMDIEYTMLSNSGVPLRAKVDLTFSYHKDPTTVAKENDLASPDMSHLVTIKDGDKLSLKCEEIYHDFNHYTDIAEVNKLTNFRYIKPGTRLHFPPLVNT